MAQNSTSLNEIAYNILDTLRAGRTNQSERFSLEHIKELVKTYRALLIRRDMQRNHSRYRLFEQDLGIVSVSAVDSADDPNVTTGEQVIRTDNQLPAPIRMDRWEGITHISCKGKFQEPIPLLDTSRSMFQTYNKFTGDQPYACLINGYIYVFNDISIQQLNIRGVFEDPEEVFDFTDSNGLDLYDEDSPFPVPKDMVQRITQAIINTEGKTLIQTVEDTELDQQQGD